MTTANERFPGGEYRGGGLLGDADRGKADGRDEAVVEEEADVLEYAIAVLKASFSISFTLDTNLLYANVRHA